jgi:hypothetical protein
MDIKKIMWQYYESEVERIKVAAPPADILKQEPAGEIQSRKLSLENVFGCLVTAGYLLSALAPGSWFSFGKFVLSFRFGFLF